MPTLPSPAASGNLSNYQILRRVAGILRSVGSLTGECPLAIRRGRMGQRVETLLRDIDGSGGVAVWWGCIPAAVLDYVL